MPEILVLGAGRVGKAIAWDLSRDFDITVGDASERNLKAVTDFADGVIVDATDRGALKELMKKFDLVVDALPGKFGFSVMKTAIESNVDVVDVSFMPENPLKLHDEAYNRGVTAIFDAGFAPGLSNVLVGRIYQEMDSLETARIYVGGLPKEPRPPLYYRITWSPKDLIEEYVRSARVIRDGRIASLDPLERIERVKINGIEFEAFLSDGLRSLLESIRVSSLEEWTLRWPGHLEKMKVLKELGFFREENVEYTLRVIEPLMDYESPDFSIMRVVGEGAEGERIEYTLYDEERGDFTSMARVTGFTAAVVSRMVLEGTCTQGVIPPEIIGMREDTYRTLIKELQNRDIEVGRVVHAPPDNSGGGP